MRTRCTHVNLRFTIALVWVLTLGFGLWGQTALAWTHSTNDPTVVVVVRHAEKQTGDDPSLTEAGQQRAQDLVDALDGADVTAIYSSQFNRTRETVAPLAEHLKLEVNVVAVNRGNLDTYSKDLADRILAEHRGETVVVVNHSNTVPQIVESLGGDAISEIHEDEYDFLFIVIVPDSGPVRTLKVQFGV